MNLTIREIKKKLKQEQLLIDPSKGRKNNSIFIIDHSQPYYNDIYIRNMIKMEAQPKKLSLKLYFNLGTLSIDLIQFISNKKLENNNMIFLIERNARYVISKPNNA